MNSQDLACRLKELAAGDRPSQERETLLAAAAHLDRLLLYEQIVAHLPDMVFVKEAQNLRFVLVNEAGEKLLGIPFQELEGRSDYDFFPKSEADFFTGKDREVLERGLLLDIPDEPILTRGGERSLHTRKIPLLDEAGRPQYLLGISRDITETLLVEQRLREVVQTARVFVWETNPEGRVTYLAGRMEEILGSPAQALLGRYWWDLTRPEQAQGMREWWGAILSGGMSFDGVQMPLCHRQGQPVWVTLSGRPLSDSRDTFVGYRGAAVDISERKVRELELAESNQRLEQATARAEQAAREAEQANRAKSIFLASISHELRTPMNGVVGMAGLLRTSALNDEQRDYVRTIQASADSMINIINDLLDYSKIEAGGVELDSVLFDPREPLEEAVDLLAPLAFEKDLELTLDLAPTLPSKVRGDAARLRQVVVNLLGNAIKFTQRGSVELKLDATSRRGRVKLLGEVRDTGIGIPQDRMDRLFKPFSQIDASTTRRFGGTGLGLAITRRLVELMGGTVVVESVPGEGSIFRFTAWLDLETGDEPTVAWPGRTVLLVGRDSRSRKILEEQLKSWGLVVEVAEVSSLPPGSWDLAVVAQLEPGDPWLRELHERNPHMGLIALVVPGQSPSARDSYLAYLPRPVRPTQLRRTLQGLLSPEGEASTGASPIPSLPTLRILLAEDNLVNQKVARLMLRELGQPCTIVSNGREALEALRSQSFDVILMDIQMPEMDGLEATRQILASQASPPCIIALTAGVSSDDRDRAREAGMRDFLAKPFKREQLREALARACRERV